MSNYSKTEQEVMRVHSIFWQAFADRNIDLRFSVCADNVTFIGTGLHERSVNKEEYRKANEKGLEQYPNPFKIEFLWIHPTILRNVAWIECEALWQQTFNGVDAKELVRNTTILKKIDKKWCVVHVHGSVPDYRLSNGEFMTNEVTIRRNLKLEKLVYERTQELNKSLQDLRDTQSQLIQSEKMASLGQLTAGIAHEIQNPLNFVNNFAEIGSELLDEMEKAMLEKDSDEAIKIAEEIKENLRKINYHGKRADAIVKGMLQHSRTSSASSEPTDINVLADEYLRLSYHGLRAKDKTFNATMETHYDESLEKINVIPQDIGRVILNLFTNAFYSVSEKKKIAKQGYVPTVFVSTKKIKNYVQLRVRDNGMGIPQKVLDKIYQPFFTTKPTGKGTGLGLSLSYDIIKAHNGSLKVETKEGEFAEFIVELPLRT